MEVLPPHHVPPTGRISWPLTHLPGLGFACIGRAQPNAVRGVWPLNARTLRLRCAWSTNPATEASLVSGGLPVLLACCTGRCSLVVQHLGLIDHRRPRTPHHRGQDLVLSSMLTPPGEQVAPIQTAGHRRPGQAGGRPPNFGEGRSRRSDRHVLVVGLAATPGQGQSDADRGVRRQRNQVEAASVAVSGR